MHTYPFWSPRFWHGMRFGHWMQLLAENHYRVSPTRVVMAGLISLISPCNSGLARLQRLRHGSKISRTRIEDPPVFIVGHWRSGTTYLHELLDLDARFACPTTYQCFAPAHFLVSEWLLARFVGLLLPRHRPMDNVKAGWQQPQEDEFALLTLGAHTPYRRMAFPNEPPPDMEYLDMDGIGELELQEWKSALRRFIKALTYYSHKRLILKSPTHTGRVGVLSELFPGAKFVHITRHPYSLFPSTRRLWRSLDQVQGCQVPRHERLSEYVFEAFERMYGGFFRQSESLAPSNLIELRYEDLVADPLENIRRVYEQLELGDFKAARPALQAYAQRQRDYKTNRYHLEPDVKIELQRRWAEYFRRYDYATDA